MKKLAGISFLLLIMQPLVYAAAGLCRQIFIMNLNKVYMVIPI